MRLQTEMPLSFAGNWNAQPVTQDRAITRLTSLTCEKCTVTYIMFHLQCLFSILAARILILGRERKFGDSSRSKLVNFLTVTINDIVSHCNVLYHHCAAVFLYTVPVPTLSSTQAACTASRGHCKRYRATGPQGRSQCGLDSIHRRSCGTCL